MNDAMRARREQLITDAIHKMKDAHPNRDDLSIITEVADEHGWTISEVQQVYDRKFRISNG